MIEESRSSLAIWYSDEGTVGGMSGLRMRGGGRMSMISFTNDARSQDGDGK